MSSIQSISTTPTGVGGQEETPDNTQPSLFSYKGRLSVLGYMARILFAYIAFFIALGISYVLLEETPLSGAQLLVLVLIILPPFWVTTTLLVKRLHDINMSGWWILTMYVPILGVIFSLYVGLLPGESQKNRFGNPAPFKKWEKPLGIFGAVVVVSASVFFTISEIIEALGFEGFI